jgi:hypothetical protein
MDVDPQADDQETNNQQNRDDGNGNSRDNARSQDQPADEASGAPDDTERTEDIKALELGNEDQYDVLDDSDGKDNDDDEITWSTTVLEHSDIPSGRLTVMLERPRERRFIGPRHDRPFLNLPLAAVSFQLANSEAELRDHLEAGPVHRVKLQLHYSNQGFKDQV